MTNPTSWQITQQLYVTGWVNIRRTPGYVDQPADDILGTVAPGMPATLINGPQVHDGLTWWQVQTTLDSGSKVVGWAAQEDGSGTVLLSTSEPEPAPSPTTGGYNGEVYTAGSRVFNCCGEPVNLRRSAGFVGKDVDDLLVMIPAGGALTVEDGPREVDDLVWWRVRYAPSGNATVSGWVAEAASNGMRLIASALAGAESLLHKPFAGDWTVSQWWGSDPDFYARFLYDGVPLRGHNGIDFATPMGTPLVASDAGEVIKVDYEHGGFGHHILIRHSWGESLYAHLDTVGIRYGAHVTRGQQIGTTGDTDKMPTHLHFGIRLFPYRRTDGWGGFTDPRPFMNPADLIVSRSGESEPVPMAEEIPGRPRP